MAPRGVAATGSHLNSGAGTCLRTRFSFVAGGSSGALAKVLGESSAQIYLGQRRDIPS
jgi:hypothetical protein